MTTEMGRRARADILADLECMTFDQRHALLLYIVKTFEDRNERSRPPLAA